jgi:hypothetical protein
MSPMNRWRPMRGFTLALGLAAFAGCVVQTPPTLDEVRTGRVRGGVTADTALQPGEIRGEVTALDPARREIRVRTDDGRTRVLVYDRPDTFVTYHGRDYRADQLEAGDLIAFRTRARDGDEVACQLQDPRWLRGRSRESSTTLESSRFNRGRAEASQCRFLTTRGRLMSKTSGACAEATM